MRHKIVGFGGALAVGALCGTAGAQERAEGYLSQHVAAPSDALELKVGTGYTQGFGMLAPGRALPDVGGAGIGVSMDVDYRISRPWSLGVEGQYQELTNEQNSSARGLAANLGVTYHFDPVLRGDPWLRLGTGYRMLWENDPGTTSGLTVLRHGFELAALKIGYDVRVSEDVAIAPVVGADFNVFVWQDASNSNDHALSSAEAGTFIYAGLQGRFDIGGERGGAVMTAAAPTPPPPVTITAATAPAPEPVQETKPVSPSIAVSEDVMRECKLNLDAIDKAPKFDFDKSDLLPPDIDVLKQIGACFATGPLKGMPMILVGRADPRGTVEYNQNLGMRRAHGVATFIEGLGVDAGQIEEKSRGKLDATGTDEATWAIDRRVDILLGGQ